MSEINNGDALECPACRYEIVTEYDHEPDCPNRSWDRDDVVDHIIKEAEQQNADAKRAEREADRLIDKHEQYGSGWPR